MSRLKKRAVSGLPPPERSRWTWKKRAGVFYAALNFCFARLSHSVKRNGKNRFNYCPLLFRSMESINSASLWCADTCKRVARERGEQMDPERERVHSNQRRALARNRRSATAGEINQSSWRHVYPSSGGNWSPGEKQLAIFADHRSCWRLCAAHKDPPPFGAMNGLNLCHYERLKANNKLLTWKSGV